MQRNRLLRKLVTKEKREAMAAIRALQEILRELEERRWRLQIAFAELFEIAKKAD